MPVLLNQRHHGCCVPDAHVWVINSAPAPVINARTHAGQQRTRIIRFQARTTQPPTTLRAQSYPTLATKSPVRLFTQSHTLRLTLVRRWAKQM